MSRGREPGGHEPRAAQRTLALLEAAARLGAGASAQEIARAADVAPTTAYRLLNLLVADGYLVRMGDLSGFALGRRTRELAAGPGPGPGAWDELPRLVAGLRGRVRVAVHVVSFGGDRLRLVDRDPDHEAVVERATAAHPHASAAGKLLLAHRPSLLGATTLPLQRLTAHTITEPAALAAELSAVRDRDLAAEVEELRLGRSAVAVPLRESATVVGALVAAGPAGRVADAAEELAGELREISDRVRGCAGEDDRFPCA